MKKPILRYEREDVTALKTVLKLILAAIPATALSDSEELMDAFNAAEKALKQAGG